MAKALKDGGSESVSGQRASVPVEQSGRVSLLNSFIGSLKYSSSNCLLFSPFSSNTSNWLHMVNSFFNSSLS